MGFNPVLRASRKIAQQEIGRKTSGAVANMPAQPIYIMRDLNRDLKGSNGEESAVRGDVFPAKGAAAVQDLTGEMPLIIGSMGHAVGVTLWGSRCGAVESGYDGRKLGAEK